MFIRSTLACDSIRAAASKEVMVLSPISKTPTFSDVVCSDINIVENVEWLDLV